MDHVAPGQRVDGVVADLRTVVGELGTSLVATGVAFVAIHRTLVAAGQLVGYEVPLVGVAATARQLFRQTQPPLRGLHLQFALGHVAIVPVVDHMLVLRTSAALAASDVLAAVGARHHELVGLATTHDRGAPTEDTEVVTTAAQPSAAEQASRALEGLNRIVRATRHGLGGPVVRNYLRKTRAGLDATLDGYQVDLEGVVSLAAGMPTAPPAALGAWAAATYARARAVFTDLDRSTLHELVGDLAADLTGAGFFADPSRGQGQG